MYPALRHFRIFKDAVRTTNKKNIQRDLTSYESAMQALRFVAIGQQDIRFPASPGSGIKDLINSGIFQSSYIQHNGRPWEPKNDKEDSLVCDENVMGIRLHGSKWSSSRVHQQGLPPSPLTGPQIGELGDAYKEQGDVVLKLSYNISYFNGVSYWILAADICDGRGIWNETGWVKVTVCVGDVLEVLYDVDDRAFVKVRGIMQHERSVFFVVNWLVPTGQCHPRFDLPEYVEERLFVYAGFFSLKTVDHLRFVNQVVFHDAGNNRFVRNDWTFNAA
jgi:hypothetical protein